VLHIKRRASVQWPRRAVGVHSKEARRLIFERRFRFHNSDEQSLSVATVLLCSDGRRWCHLSSVATNLMSRWCQDHPSLLRYMITIATSQFRLIAIVKCVYVAIMSVCSSVSFLSFYRFQTMYVEIISWLLKRFYLYVPNLIRRA
jgi:hypothetical protein